MTAQMKPPALFIYDTAKLAALLAAAYRQAAAVGATLSPEAAVAAPTAAACHKGETK